MPAVLLPLLVIGGVFAVAYVGFSRQPTGGDSPFVAGTNAAIGVGLPPGLQPCAQSMGQGVAAGASAGAAAGSVVPLVGNLIGAFVGAIAGAVAGGTRDECRAGHRDPVTGDWVTTGTPFLTLAERGAADTRLECYSDCNMNHTNHSLIGPGGRPWRECRQTCRDTFERDSGGFWAGVAD